jgi:trans-2,3-dihydro-3-hydroxyanthranilate isomerase
MTQGRRFYVVDAFSDRPFCGNPAIIVPDAAGLSDRAMQALAAEMRMEAGFVLPPTSDGADLRVRFFSPGAEVDVSGHVTVAVYAALQAAAALPTTPHVRQESRAGVHPVELDGGWVTLALGRPVFGQALDRREVAEVFRVGEAALAPGPAPRAVTCGVPFVVTGIIDSRVLGSIVPDMARVAALSRRRGVLGVAAFALPGLHPQSALTARFFFPAVGPDEDVVSGAALAAICAYAVRERQLTCIGETTFQTDQGHSLGRPNRAHVTVRTEAGQLTDLRVRGRGTVVASGEFSPID